MNSETNASSGSRVRWIKRVVQVTILAAVLWGVWRTVDDARDKFAAADFSPASLSLPWLIAAGAFYVAGMFPSCLFWRRTMRTMDQDPSFASTLKAFYIGHLGKYVPGKALVVVLRTGLIRGPRVDTAVAATSVFVETLTLMAVGAVLSALILALQFREHQMLLLLAIFLAACAGVPTLPPLFRRIVGILQVRRASPQIEAAVARLNYALMGYGWITITVGWFGFGLSLWATLRAIPAELSLTPVGHPGQHLLLLVACVALAMVAGFLSLLPGGVGVREFVVMSLLAPVFGEVVAIVSAIALRVVWMGSELIVASIVYLFIPKE